MQPTLKPIQHVPSVFFAHTTHPCVAAKRQHLPLTASAFTLIELLTVIIIIGILAAIIIPTVGKVREQAATATTLSNLRQLATGARLYANENKGKAPQIFTDGGTKCWAHALSEGGYLGNLSTDDRTIAFANYVRVFINPLVRRKDSRGSNYGSFGMNGFANYNIQQNLDILTRPSRTVLFADGCLNNPNSGNVDWVLSDGGGSVTRHPNTLSGGCAHYVFVDGSARKISAQNPTDRNSPPVGHNTTIFYKD